MKIFKILFLLCSAALLLLPLAFTTMQEQVASPLDNRMLAEIPKTIQDWRLEGENVLKDRIGFRDPMIVGYHTALKKLFSVMQHPLFITGEDGHIYFGHEGYLKSYQSLDCTPEKVSYILRALKDINERLAKKKIPFLYVNFPDKKSIYPEHYSRTIFRQNKPTLNEALEQALAGSEVPYIFATEALLKAKKERPTHNQKFDPGHFNAYGAFVAHRAVAEKLREFFPDYPLLRLDEFEQTTRVIDLRQYTSIADTDTVPMLTLKERNFKIERPKAGDEFLLMASNANAPIKKTLFLYGDSYMMSCDCYSPTNTAIDYYAKAFSKVYIFGSGTAVLIDQHIQRYGCDMVIYETAERVVPLSGVFNWLPN